MTAERPFSEEQPVDLTSRLVGRRIELDVVLDEVEKAFHNVSPRTEAFSVVGSRDMGTTSFMEMLREEAMAIEIPVASIDFEEYKNISPESLVALVGRDVGIQLIVSRLEQVSAGLGEKFRGNIETLEGEALQRLGESLLSGRPHLVLLDFADSTSEEVELAVINEIGARQKRVFAYGSCYQRYPGYPSFQEAKTICLGPLTFEETQEQIGDQLGEEVYPYSFGYPRVNLMLAEVIKEARTAGKTLSPNELIGEAREIVREFALQGLSEEQKDGLEALAGLSSFSISDVEQALDINAYAALSFMGEVDSFLSWETVGVGYTSCSVVEPYRSILK